MSHIVSIVQASGWFAIMDPDIEYRVPVICWAVVDEGRRVTGLIEVNKQVVRADKQGGFLGYEQAHTMEIGSRSGPGGLSVE